MPRFYSNIVRPSSNKAKTPEPEKKGGGKPPVPPVLPKSEEKKAEGGEK